MSAVPLDRPCRECGSAMDTDEPFHRGGCLVSSARAATNEDDHVAVIHILLAQRALLEGAMNQVDASLRLLAKEPPPPPEPAAATRREPRVMGARHSTRRPEGGTT